MIILGRQHDAHTQLAEFMAKNEYAFEYVGECEDNTHYVFTMHTRDGTERGEFSVQKNMYPHFITELNKAIHQAAA